MKSRNGSSKSAPEGLDANNIRLNEYVAGSSNTQTRYVDFGLRRLVHPGDLEYPPDGDGSSNPEDVVNAACDNLAVVGQDMKDGALLVRRGVAGWDPVAVTSGLWALVAQSAQIKDMLDVQFSGLQGMAVMMLGKQPRPDPVIKSRAPLLRAKCVEKPGRRLDRAVSAVIRMGERVKGFDGQFRGNFVDTKTATTMKSLRKLQSLRLTLPDELKEHVRTILDIPKVRALLPKAGRLKVSANHNQDWDKPEPEDDYSEPTYRDFGLRRLVHPEDLEFWPYGRGLDEVIHAASDNLLVVGQDLKAAVLLTKRAMAEKDRVALTAGLLGLAALSANMEPVLESQYDGLRLMMHIMLDRATYPDPEHATRASSHLKQPTVASFSRSVSAIYLMGNQVEELEGLFRYKFECNRDEDTTEKSVRKLQLLRLTLPRKLKGHVITILDSPEVRALVPEAGRLKGKPVPLFTCNLTGSAIR